MSKAAVDEGKKITAILMVLQCMLHPGAHLRLAPRNLLARDPRPIHETSEGCTSVPGTRRVAGRHGKATQHRG